MAEQIIACSGSDVGIAGVAAIILKPILDRGTATTDATYDETKTIALLSAKSCKFESVTSTATTATVGGNITSTVNGDGTVEIDSLGFSNAAKEVLFKGLEKRGNAIGASGNTVVGAQCGIGVVYKLVNGKYLVKTAPCIQVPYKVVTQGTVTDGKSATEPASGTFTMEIEKLPGCSATYEEEVDTEELALVAAKKIIPAKVVTP